MKNRDVDRALLLELSTTIVVACLKENRFTADELSNLITCTYRALQSTDHKSTHTAQEPIQKPFVPIKKSVTRDYIICLEDGKQFKSMKGHLATLGMTPEQYRRKWGLSDDYPIVAPSYAASRSALAKKSRFGQKPWREYDRSLNSETETRVAEE